jgi:Rieske Fe-S protein
MREEREIREKERKKKKRKEKENKEKTTHLFTYYSFIIVIYSCTHRGCSWHNVFLSLVKCVSTTAQKFNS